MPLSRPAVFLKERLLHCLVRLESLADSLKRRLLPAPLVLFRDVTAPWLVSALTLAVELRLAERVQDKAWRLEELALELDLPLDELTRFFSVLTAHGYFFVEPGGRIRQTGLSRALSWTTGGAFTALQGSAWYRQAFETSAVVAGWRQGRTPFELSQGEPFFAHLSRDRAAGQQFFDAMTNVTRFCAPYLVESLPLRPGESYLDLGGGDGELARALQVRYPKSRLAVLDREGQRLAAVSSLFSDEISFHRGDFFQPLPLGYGGVILKNILHDWPDEQALTILRNAREAVGTGGRVFLVECLLPEPGRWDTQARATHALDWNVWLTLSGKERTESQYRRLLEQARWQWLTTRRTATPYAVLEAVARD